MSKIDVSLILACYNEGSTFENSVWKIEKGLKKLKGPWEIIFVEDKSTDNTRAKVLQLAQEIKNSKVVLHPRNMGRGKTVADGIRAAKGTVCGYIDVDCEISPKYIPVFIKEVESGSDMVVASRYYKKDWKSVSRIVSSVIYSKMVAAILKLPIDDTEAGYKFFKRNKILPVLEKTRDHGWFWDTEICARSYLFGLKIKQLRVLFERRAEKKSTVRLFPDSLDYVKKLWAFQREYRKEQNGKN